MSNQQIGCYIRILCHMADKGRLKESQIKSICRNEFFGDDLRGKFSVDEKGGFYNERLEKEVEKRRLYSLSRSNNRTYNKKIRKSYVPHMENENRNENEVKDLKKSFGEDGLVMLTVAQLEKLVARLGEKRTHEYIQRLENYIGSKGKRYRSHYHTILNWLGNDDDQKNPLNLNTKQKKNMEALSDFTKRKGTVRPENLRAGDGDVIGRLPGDKF